MECMDLYDFLESVMQAAEEETIIEYCNSKNPHRAAVNLYFSVSDAATSRFHEMEDISAVENDATVNIEDAEPLFEQRATCLMSIPVHKLRTSFYLDAIDEIWMLEDETLFLVRCTQFERDGLIVDHRVCIKAIQSLDEICIPADSIVEELDDYIMFSAIIPIYEKQSKS